MVKTVKKSGKRPLSEWNKFVMGVKKQNPMWNPLTLTWKNPVKTPDGKEMPTVLSLNKNEKMKSKNRRIQITFLNPPHHGKGRSATSYED